MVFFSESLQNKRARNEDAYCHMDLQIDHEATVSAFAVADGMGGLSAGNRYSRMAVSLWYEELLRLLINGEFRGCSLKDQIEVLKDFSSEVFHRINLSLYKWGMDAGQKGGTTLTTAIFFWDTWIFACSGDSPAYVLKDGKLNLVTELQNLAWKMVREGKTRVGSTLFLQNKNRLIEFLGQRQEIHPGLSVLEEDRADAVIMGSDGLFGDLRTDRMEEILRDRDRSRILTSLMEAAREGGETDNQTGFLIYPPGRQTGDRSEQDSLFSGDGEEVLPITMRSLPAEDPDRVSYRQVDESAAGGLFRRLFGKKGDRT